MVVFITSDLLYVFLFISFTICLSLNSGYLQNPLPNIVLSKDEIFSLNMNDYFQMNSPLLSISNPSFKSTIDWQIKTQYNPITEFPIDFNLIKTVYIKSTPYIIFLSPQALYLYEFINSKSIPKLLQNLNFRDYNNFFEKDFDCLDLILLEHAQMVVDCNIFRKENSAVDSIFFIVDLEEGYFKTNYMKIKACISYHVELYFDYMLYCPRKLYYSNNKLLQYCKYLSLIENQGSCFEKETCSNQLILWEINENKINYLLILDEFTLNIKLIFLPLKIQDVLVNWKTDVLMILDMKKGVYQFTFSNLQLKQEKMIDFNDENNTIYQGMELNKLSGRMPFVETLSKLYLIIWSTRYCVEVLLKESHEFYFAKRYDYKYFIQNYLDNSSNLFFSEQMKKPHKSENLTSIDLKSVHINNNFLNLVLELRFLTGLTDRYQLIFSRKQDRIAIHYIRLLLNKTDFLRINFLYDEGDYYLEMVQNENLWRLTEITDLYLILSCCPIALTNKIFHLTIPFQIFPQGKSNIIYDNELSLTLIPLSYPHVLPATKQLKFQFEDPIIYIKLANIAIGPEIEFIYLSGNNENFKLTIDHIHQTALDLDENLIERLLKFELLASWMDNENLFLRLIFKYKEISELGIFYRLVALECLNISYIYIGNCRLLTRYDSVVLLYPIDFYLETHNSLIYIHEINEDHIHFFNPIQNQTASLFLTPTKTYSIVIFSPPNLIFGIPTKNNSIELYYTSVEDLQNIKQTEKLLNIDSHYLGLAFELNISQIDLTLIEEGIIILVCPSSESSSNLIVLQMVQMQSTSMTPRFIVRLASVLQISLCEILVLKTKKIILVCSDQITEMRLNNPFYVVWVRSYPLYRYNLNRERGSFTDDKLVYVYANYYSLKTLNIQPVLLVYDPSKTAGSLLVTTINLNSIQSLVNCLHVKTDFSLLFMSVLNDYPLSKNKVKEKSYGIILNMIALQPALSGVFRFKDDKKSHNKTQNEQIFEINVSFTNENSNLNLVSTLNIGMNLKDYNIFVANQSLNNDSILLKFSKKNRKHLFLNTNFFKGPIEDYELKNERNDFFMFTLKDYLTEGAVIADYQQSLYHYGIILDMISTTEFIIVLSQYKLILYQTKDFPLIFYEESLQYKIDRCKLSHHKIKMSFLLSCFNSFDLVLYEYNRNKQIEKNVIKIPNYVGLISNIVSISNYIFLQTHLFNTLNETEFCVCEFPKLNSNGSLKVLGIINSEDFKVMIIKSQDFELFPIFSNGTLLKFGLFIMQSFQILYMEMTILDNKIFNKSLFAMAVNPFPASFTSISIDKMLISPNLTSSYLKIVGLIGTDEHLYEIELEFEPYKRKINFLNTLFVYRKYCKCKNLAAKTVKFGEYVGRVCSYNLTEKDFTVSLFKEERKDLYHFIQIYKKIENEQETHPIRVIKVLFSPEISKLFLFYTSSYPNNGSIHLLTSSYLNYLIDFEINQWMRLDLYFLKERERIIGTKIHNLKIIAKNDFSKQDINVSILIEGDIEENVGGSGALVIFGVCGIVLIGFGGGIWLLLRQRKKNLEELKVKEKTILKKTKSRVINNIELGYVD